jgi:Carbohydrate binding domain
VRYRPYSATLTFLFLSLLTPSGLIAGIWNGTFEDGALSPWVIASGPVVIGTVAHTGNYGMTMGPGTSKVMVSQPVSGLVPGQTYVVSAWVKASAANESAELAVGGAAGLAGSPVSPSISWQQVSQTYTVSTDGAVTISLEQLPSSVSGAIYWDDVKLMPVPPANPGFESPALGPWIISQGSGALGTTAHSGRYGLTMAAGGVGAIAQQTVAGLAPGATYVVTAWVQASASAAGGAELAVGGVGGLSGTEANLSTPWQQVSQSYTVGADGSLVIYLAQLDSAVTVNWDDVAVSAGSGGTPIPNVLTYHNDLSRTGQNTGEVALTPSNVAISTFGELFSLPVDGFVLAQPLYIAGQFIPGGGFHNATLVATEEESVYLFDADSDQGANGNPLWHISLIDTAHGGYSGETSAPSGPCNFGPKNEGVTSTPVIDPDSGVVYVEAKSSVSGNVIHRLHALDVTTGAEEPGWPIIIGGSVAGTGDAAVNGQLTFNPNAQLNRVGLLLSGGIVYVAFGSNGCDSDYGDVYHGWLFGYDAATGSESLISLTPNGHADSSGAPAGGSIWMAGAGPAADAIGNVYAASGNGTFDTTLNANGMPSLGDYGDSILKFAQLRRGGIDDLPMSLLTVSDYFTPLDQSTLDDHDKDLGSGGVLLLPDQPGLNPHLLVHADKEGTIRLINRDNMGQYCASCSSDPVDQELTGALPLLELGLPAYWNGFVYFGGARDYIREYSLAGGLLSTTPTATSTDPVPNFYGTTPSVSAAGTSNAIVWGIQSWSGLVGLNGVLKAWNAESLELLYSSNNVYASDNAGGYVEFSVPTVAHGKVYVGAQNSVAVYGILPSARSALVTNGDFETGSPGPSWNSYIPPGGTGGLTLSPEAALSGNYGLVEGPNSNAEVAYQTLQGLTPGQSYVVSAWVSLGSGTPGSVYLYADDTTGGNTCVSPFTVPATQWQPVACVYTATANQSMNVHLVENAGSFTTYWDNVSVTPVPLLNPGFETGTFSPPWNSFIPPGGTGSVSVSASAAYSGSYGLVEGPNSSAEVAYQIVNSLTPGQSYLASAWVALGSGTAGTAYLYADDSTGANACGSSVVAPTATWQPLSCAYTVTNNRALSVHLVENSGQFSTYWDNTALTPLPPVNGGFESGNLGYPWMTYIPTGGTGSFGISAAAAHSGSYGLVEGPNTNIEAVYQTVYGLVSGQSYLISVWVMLGSSASGNVYLYASDTGSSYACGTPLIPATPQWQQISCVFTATSFQAASIYLVQNPGSFTAYWDDVAVTPVPPVNGGFENGTFSQPWTAFISSAGTGAISVSTMAARTGTYGMVEGPNTAGEEARQNVYGITTGQAYLVSAWVRLGSGSAGSVYLGVDDTTGADSCTTPAVTPTMAWAQISCTFTATSTGAMTIHLREVGGSFTTYWDDVEVSGPLANNIWENFAPTSVWVNFGFSRNY